MLHAHHYGPAVSLILNEAAGLCARVSGWSLSFARLPGRNPTRCPDSSCPAGGAGPAAPACAVRSVSDVAQPGRRRRSPRSLAQTRRRRWRPATRRDPSPAAVARAPRHAPVTERGAEREATVAEVSAGRKGLRGRGGVGPGRRVARAARRPEGGEGWFHPRRGCSLSPAVGALGSPHRLVLWPARCFGAHLFPLPTPTPARSFPLSRDSAAAFPAGPTLLRDLCLPAATTFPRLAGIWFSSRRFLARWALPWPVAARAAQDAGTGLGALCPQRGKKAGWGRWPGVPWLWASAQRSEAFGGLLVVGIRSIYMVLRLKWLLGVTLGAANLEGSFLDSVFWRYLEIEMSILILGSQLNALRTCIGLGL